MDQMNFHKQKLYSLIIAGVALISMLLPWITITVFIASKSYNGFNGWGWLSFLGIAAVVALSFMGNKQENYTPEYKRYVWIAFAAVALGALLFLIRKNAVVTGGEVADLGDLVKTGYGLWICLLAGLTGAILNYGLIKYGDDTTSKSSHTGTTTTLQTPTTENKNTTV